MKKDIDIELIKHLVEKYYTLNDVKLFTKYAKFICGKLDIPLFSFGSCSFMNIDIYFGDNRIVLHSFVKSSTDNWLMVSFVIDSFLIKRSIRLEKYGSMILIDKIWDEIKHEITRKKITRSGMAAISELMKKYNYYEEYEIGIKRNSNIRQ